MLGWEKVRIAPPWVVQEKAKRAPVFGESMVLRQNFPECPDDESEEAGISAGLTQSRDT